ncbi:transposase [Centipeda periodontii DSM 2778]|uniref:Transposase n=1 Tax=Centipeda periodontii DSM 2778 TaxID=888060 RepID=F5RK90_9FIRM|nr:hypothetical protein [Centipeda periodontii]EGK61090.1 transposase [Centipeda periodontii DSM 2778]
MAANRQYDHEFKVQAIKLAQEIGQAKAAKELGISKNTSIHGHAHTGLDIWILGAARKHRRVP